jgi:hypothetical protein
MSDKFVSRKEFETLEARVTALERHFLPDVVKRSPKPGDYVVKRRKKKRASRPRPPAR